jgi:hypothetical protein
VNSESVWETLVLDAKNRQCFFNADEDKDLAKAILDVKKELEQFDSNTIKRIHALMSTLMYCQKYLSHLLIFLI